MAELIKKNELIEALTLSHTAHANNTREASLLNRDVRIVMEQPTTTEAEIRAKAIDEFAEKLLEEVEANPVDVGGRYSYMIPQSFLEGQIKDIAEQLKAGE